MTSRPWIVASFALVVTACGGKVVVGTDQGQGGAGGTSTSTATTTNVGTTTSSTGYGGQGPGPSVASASSGVDDTVSVGTGPSCDGQGDCQTCADCSVTNQCAMEYANCGNDPACGEFANCVQQCPGPMTPCWDKCTNQNPNGAMLYSGLLQCVICQECVSDCVDYQMYYCQF